MSEMYLSCPRCDRPLRITPDLQGKPAKCPACGMIFLASSTATEPEGPPPARALPEAVIPQGPIRTEEPPRPQQAPKRRSVMGAVRPPAIGLLVLGIISGLFQALEIAYGLMLKYEVIKLPKVEDFPPAWQELFRNAIQQISPEGMILRGTIFGLVSIVVCVAAIQMLRLRMYPLAIVGSVAMILYLESCCCILGAPFGIWALVILLREDVRQMFGAA